MLPHNSVRILSLWLKLVCLYASFRYEQDKKSYFLGCVYPEVILKFSFVDIAWDFLLGTSVLLDSGSVTLPYGHAHICLPADPGLETQ